MSLWNSRMEESYSPRRHSLVSEWEMSLSASLKPKLLPKPSTKDNVNLENGQYEIGTYRSHCRCLDGIQTDDSSLADMVR